MGIFTCLAAAATLAYRDIISKQISKDISEILSAFTSFFYALPFYLIILLGLWLAGYEDFSLGFNFVYLILARSLTDAFAEYFKMLAFARGDLSLVSPFLSLSPIFVLIFSPLITGDPLTTTGIVSIGMIVAGSLVIAWPDKALNVDRASRRSAIVTATLGAFFLGINTCFDRLAVQAGSPVMAGFSMTLVAAVLLAPFALRGKGYLSNMRASNKPLLQRGLLETLYMCLKLTALQHLQGPYVIGLVKSSIIFSVLGGKVVFKEEAFGKRMIGATLVFGGIVCILIG